MDELLHYDNIKAMLTTLKGQQRHGNYKIMLSEVVEMLDMCARIAGGTDDDEMDEIKSRIYEILS